MTLSIISDTSIAYLTSIYGKNEYFSLLVLVLAPHTNSSTSFTNHSLLPFSTGQETNWKLFVPSSRKLNVFIGSIACISVPYFTGFQKNYFPKSFFFILGMNLPNMYPILTPFESSTTPVSTLVAKFCIALSSIALFILYMLIANPSRIK